MDSAPPPDESGSGTPAAAAASTPAAPTTALLPSVLALQRLVAALCAQATTDLPGDNPPSGKDGDDVEQDEGDGESDQPAAARDSVSPAPPPSRPGSTDSASVVAAAATAGAGPLLRPVAEELGLLARLTEHLRRASALAEARTDNNSSSAAGSTSTPTASSLPPSSSSSSSAPASAAGLPAAAATSSPFSASPRQPSSASSPPAATSASSSSARRSSSSAMSTSSSNPFPGAVASAVLGQRSLKALVAHVLARKYGRAAEINAAISRSAGSVRSSPIPGASPGLPLLAPSPLNATAAGSSSSGVVCVSNSSPGPVLATSSPMVGIISTNDEGEGENSTGGSRLDSGEPLRASPLRPPMSPIPSRQSDSDAQLTQDLHFLLDQLLSWLEDQPFQLELLAAYRHAARTTADPLVRKHTLLRGLQWLVSCEFFTPQTGEAPPSVRLPSAGARARSPSPSRRSGRGSSPGRPSPLGASPARSPSPRTTAAAAAATTTSTSSNVNTADDPSSAADVAVRAFVVASVTDVWSAIRSACTSQLAHLLTEAPPEWTKELFASLAAVAAAPKSSWQQREGALLGLTTIIRKFRWVPRHHCNLRTNTVLSMTGNNNISSRETLLDRKEYLLALGWRVFPDGLPDYVMQAIKNIMFGMLANPQLSIRETATRAISAALSRSQFKEALDAFQEVVSELQGSWTSADLEDAEQRKDRSQFMNAYQAEGLLGVCLFIIKNIPPGFLLPEWPRYFSIFELYLTHPASTVRQATSAIFKYIVAKDSSNPTMLKLVLQGLAADWLVERSSITEPTPERKTHLTVAKSRAKAKRLSISSMSESGGTAYETWEWREGRLLAYELILKFLVANHVHYLFPTSLLDSPFQKQETAASGRRRLEMPNKRHLRRRSREENTMACRSWNFGSSDDLADGAASITRVRSLDKGRDPRTAKPSVDASAASEALELATSSASNSPRPSTAETENGAATAAAAAAAVAAAAVASSPTANHHTAGAPLAQAVAEAKRAVLVRHQSTPHSMVPLPPKSEVDALTAILMKGMSTPNLLAIKQKDRTQRERANSDSSKSPEMLHKQETSPGMGGRKQSTSSLSPHTSPTRQDVRFFNSHDPPEDPHDVLHSPLSDHCETAGDDIASARLPRTSSAGSATDEIGDSSPSPFQSRSEPTGALGGSSGSGANPRFRPSRGAVPMFVPSRERPSARSPLGGNSRTSSLPASIPTTALGRMGRSVTGGAAEGLGPPGPVASSGAGGRPPATSARAVAAAAAAAAQRLGSGRSSAGSVGGSDGGDGGSSGESSPSNTPRSSISELSELELAELGDRFSFSIASSSSEASQIAKLSTLPKSSSLASLPRRPPAMARRMSRRSITLHKQVESIDAVHPEQPFRRKSRKASAARSLQQLSLLSHTLALDESVHVGGLLGASDTTASDTTASDSRSIPRSGITAGQLDLHSALPEHRPLAQPSPPRPSRVRPLSFNNTLNTCMQLPLNAAALLLGGLGDEDGLGEGGMRRSSSITMHQPSTSPPRSPAGGLASEAQALPVPEWMGMVAAPAWVETSRFRPLSEVFWHMFLQTAESLGSPQFELFRISAMVLPVLSEAMRWLDPSALAEVWTSSIPRKRTWLSYVASLSFRQSLGQAARLTMLCSQADASWKGRESCCREVAQTLAAITESIVILLPAIHENAMEKDVSRGVLVSLDILMVLAIYFRDSLSDPLEQEQLVVQRFAALFKHAFPDDPGLGRAVAGDLGGFGDVPPMTGEGRFSIVSRRPQKMATVGGLVILRAMLTELRASVADFVDVCDIRLALQMHPIVLRFACSSAEEEELSKTTMEAVHRIIDRIGHMRWSLTAQYKDRDRRWAAGELASVCDLTVEVVLKSLQNKHTTDPALMRRLASLFRFVCVARRDTCHLEALFHCVLERVGDEAATLPGMLTRARSDLSSSDLAASLMFLSTSNLHDETMEDQPANSDSDDDDEKDTKHRETLALNLSNNGLKVNVETADSSSDWDSWEEDDETDTAPVLLFAELLSDVRAIFESDSVLSTLRAAQQPTFEQALQALPTAKRRQIQWIMDQHDTGADD